MDEFDDLGIEADPIELNSIAEGQIDSARRTILGLPEVASVIGGFVIKQKFAETQEEKEAGPICIVNESTNEHTIILEPIHYLWWPNDEAVRLAWCLVMAAHELRHTYPLNIELYDENPKLAELDCDWFAGMVFARIETSVSVQTILHIFEEHFGDDETHPDGSIRAWAFDQGYLEQKAIAP